MTLTHTSTCQAGPSSSPGPCLGETSSGGPADQLCIWCSPDPSPRPSAQRSAQSLARGRCSLRFLHELPAQHASLQLRGPAGRQHGRPARPLGPLWL